jgi:hypothetical protein
MKRSFPFIVLLLFAVLLVNSCKKNKVEKKEPPKPAVTTVATGLNAIAIESDHNGKLYILSPGKIRVCENGQLKTLGLPERVFSDFTFYEDGDISYGPPKYIAADRKGMIFLAQDNGFRMVYTDGRIATYTEREVGWKVSGIRDLAVSGTSEVFYTAPTDHQGKLDNYYSGLLPLNVDFNGLNWKTWDFGTVNTLDISDGNILWFGTDKGIIKLEYNGYNIIKAAHTGSSNGTQTEGPVAQVKIGNVTRLVACKDQAVICFIDEGVLKQLKDGKVKAIMPMPDTPIALSRDAKTLYFLQNGDLKMIAL